MKNLLFTNWHTMRWVRLAFSLFLFVQAYTTREWFFIAFGLFFLVLILINRKSVYKIYFLALGSLGLFFVFAGFYSLHKELLWNYNILLFNPVLFLVVYFQIKNNKKWILNTSILSILCLTIYVLIMLNKAHLLIVSPLIITSYIGLAQLIIKNKR